MKIIEQSVELVDNINAEEILAKIERCGRVCYQSEPKGNSEQFIRMLIKRGHESVLEHATISFKIICDRAIQNELVRHRIASYSVESTRYCDYSAGKFSGELTFIKPCFWQEGDANFKIWLEAMELAERNYLALRAGGARPEEARSILPNSLKTEIFVTMNLREWRHFLKLRTAKAAHPQMRQLAGMILAIFKEKLPVIVEDIQND